MINSWNQAGQLWFGISYHGDRNNKKPYSLLSCLLSFQLQFNSQLLGGLLCVSIVFILTLVFIILYLNCLSLPVGSIPHTEEGEQEQEG